MRFWIAALTVAALPLAPASAQVVTAGFKSDIAEENALALPLLQSRVVGNDANGVPTGALVNYSMANPSVCAPTIQPWISAKEAPMGLALGKPMTLRMPDVAALGENGPMLEIRFKDGTHFGLGFSSEAQRDQFVAALQAFGRYCLAHPQ